MPLDPVFAERLRTHRRYLVRTALDQARKRLRSVPPWRRGGGGEHGESGSARPPAESSPVPGPTPAAAAPAPAPGSRPIAPSSRCARRAHRRLAAASRAASDRAAKRRAALAWDRRELDTVGIPGPSVGTSEHHVPVPGRQPVRVRVYDPRPDGDTAVLPVLISFFGGSFRVGGIDYPTNDAAARRRAVEAAVLVVAVEYALAPEHRFPVAVEQGDAVLRWVAAEAATLHADPMRIALGGTSAGGGIAAAVALRSRGAVGPAVALQLLEVPALDLTARHIDLWPAVVMGVPLPLVLGEMLAVATGYLGSPLRGARNPLASPLRAPDLAGMPPAVVLTAEYDPLRRQGALYAARLRAAGIDASCVRYAGATHDVPIFGRLVPASRRWHDDVVSALRHLHD